MTNKCTVGIKLEYLPYVFLGHKTDKNFCTWSYQAFLSI